MANDHDNARVDEVAVGLNPEQTGELFIATNVPLFEELAVITLVHQNRMLSVSNDLAG